MVTNTHTIYNNNRSLWWAGGQGVVTMVTAAAAVGVVSVSCHSLYNSATLFVDGMVLLWLPHKGYSTARYSFFLVVFMNLRHKFYTTNLTKYRLSHKQNENFINEHLDQTTEKLDSLIISCHS